MNNVLKYSVEAAAAQADMLTQHADDMEKALAKCKEIVMELQSTQEFVTLAASTDFYKLIDEASENFPKFIQAINTFAEFLKAQVSSSYSAADKDAQDIQATLREEVSNLQNSGNLGA